MEWKFATTLIGSQPCKETASAVDAVLGSGVSCPAWPQMPSLNARESMYAQTGSHLPGMTVENDKVIVDLGAYDPTEIYTAILSDNVDYFVHPPESFAGLYEFLDRDLSKFQAIKGQITGPISEGLQICDRKGRPVIYDESYGEIVRKTVNMMAKWQSRRLKMCNGTVILFFDEPSVTMLGSPFASVSDDDAKKWINESMEGVDCYRGIHCCGNTNWAMILGTDIDILNFDAYQYGENLLAYTDELAEFYERGGTVAWGIVPNSESELEKVTAADVVAKLEALFDKMENKGFSRQNVASQSMITPQCGLSGISEQNIGKLYALLNAVSAEMKARYGFQ